jgi:hypothetical protein
MKNLFKSWGSYIGAFLGLIGSYFSFAIIFHLAEIGKFNYLALLIPIIPIVIGFLIGGLIHNLIKEQPS